MGIKPRALAENFSEGRGQQKKKTTKKRWKNSTIKPLPGRGDQWKKRQKSSKKDRK